jgi:hypothetical protein
MMQAFGCIPVWNASCRAVLYSAKRLIPDGMIIFKSLNKKI